MKKIKYLTNYSFQSKLTWKAFVNLHSVKKTENKATQQSLQSLALTAKNLTRIIFLL